jgi:indolepyruvate ferredoxin oxidoreductase beta subunit
MMKKEDLLMVGVGGQGVILASNILGNAAIAEGYDVKKTDTLGMAQRGGSVISHVRLADKVFSPLIKEGEVDIIVAFEKLETARWSHYLKPGGLAIMNNLSLPPLSVSLGSDQYPSDSQIVDMVRQCTDRIHVIDGARCEAELGNSRLLNTFMLGYTSLFLPIRVQTFTEVIAQHLPSRIRQINLDAFERGRMEVPLELPVPSP